MIGLSHVMFFIVVITTGRCHSAVSLGHLIHVCKTSAQDHFDSEILTLALMAEIRFMKGCQPKAVNQDVTKCYKKQGKLQTRAFALGLPLLLPPPVSCR